MADANEFPVRFHRLTDEHGAFTTFSRHLIIIDAVVWASAEHYFQAAKFTDSRHIHRIRGARTPSRAAALGRTRTVRLRPDWDTARVEVMRTGMRAKFTQHPQLAHQLLATGDRPLIETTRRDLFWGAGADGTGRNMTGHLLSEIRAELATTCCCWIPPAIGARRWVAFGADTVVLPLLTPGNRHVTVQALRLLVNAATTTVAPVRDSEADDQQHLRVQVPGAGEVLLRAPAPLGLSALQHALTRAAAEPITWVHDPRWPRGRS